VRLTPDVAAPAGPAGLAPSRGKPLWRSLIEVLLAIGFVIALFNALAVTVRVENDDMSPILRPGQQLLVSRIPYRLTLPRRGDIVVVHSRIDPTQLQARRVIGLPGDRISIKGVQVSLDGQPLPEPYLPEGQERLGVNPLTTGQYVVPDNRYFLLNDNRAALEDSRSYGMVSPDEIVGRAWLVYWPLENIAPVQHARLSVAD
jgi:signal peptidase I